MTLYTKESKNKQGIKKTLWVNFTHNGKRYRKSLDLEDTPANRKIAETQYMPILRYKIISGEFFKNTNSKIPTVNEYMERSFELRKGGRCSSTIYAHEKNYLKYLKAPFGNKQLDKITSSEITIWQNNLQEKEHLAKATILKIRSCINSMYEDAIEESIIKFNPISKAKKLKETENPKVNRVKLKPFNQKEISKILNTAQHQDKNMLATFFFTGLRASELIGLKWESIDFKNNTIAVREQIVQGNHKNILKTTKSRRIIPIIKILLPYLENQYKITGSQNSYVFLTKKSNKHFHSAGKIREQIWIKILESANVNYRNLHQTRGTFISTLISNGEDITYVSKIAGHENVKVTLEKYSEYIPVKNENFGECFGKV
ncbi:site-specific integrase [Arcobacter sp. LA11]|uniref:site-specific integrase n=1 Tax=Arcobacter sp. LA11 TaxID=1898176 RepID=UPI0009FAB402|nr:site-specific integrase [Arcobacter sp. LA11]